MGLRSNVSAMTFCVILLITAASATADESESKKATSGSVKLTIVLRGAATGADLKPLLSALRQVDGVRILSDEVELGFRKFRNRFSTPVIVSVPTIPGDNDVNIGQLATAVSKARTPGRDEYPPGVNLILFTDERLQESSISSLRSSLNSVNGVEVNKPGGLGGNIQGGWCWIQLEEAGGAMLNEIEEKARNSGVRFRRLMSQP